MTPGNIADHEPEDRHSKALEAELISDPDALARQEARNGLRIRCRNGDGRLLFAAGETLQAATVASLASTSHRARRNQPYAGNFRPAGIEIRGSKHQPVGAIRFRR